MIPVTIAQADLEYAYRQSDDQLRASLFNLTPADVEYIRTRTPEQLAALGPDAQYIASRSPLQLRSLFLGVDPAALEMQGHAKDPTDLVGATPLAGLKIGRHVIAWPKVGLVIVAFVAIYLWLRN